MGKNGSTWKHSWVPTNAAAALLKTHGRSSSFHAFAPPSSVPKAPKVKAPAAVQPARRAPRGVTIRVDRWDNGDKTITAVKPGHGVVGQLNASATGRIDDISVAESHRRQGIAAALYHAGQQATGGKLRHSTDRTAEGDAFARAMGGVIPPRSAFRGR